MTKGFANFILLTLYSIDFVEGFVFYKFTNFMLLTLYSIDFVDSDQKVHNFAGKEGFTLYSISSLILSCSLCILLILLKRVHNFAGKGSLCILLILLHSIDDSLRLNKSYWGLAILIVHHFFFFLRDHNVLV